MNKFQNLSSMSTDHLSSDALFFQTLEKRFMYDGASVTTLEKALDSAHILEAQEQQEVLTALTKNPYAIATPSLLSALDLHQATTLDYSTIREVVFIESDVEDPHELIASISRNAAVEIINSHEDGIAQITTLLSKYQNLTAIDIITHGSDGQLLLGSSTLNLQTLSQYSSQLEQWSQALSTEGSILLYGCNVAQSDSGKAFVDALGELTSANIEASTNSTGGTALGGDWLFEYSSKSNILESIIEAPAYEYLLDISVDGLTDQSYFLSAPPIKLDTDVTFSGLTDFTIGSMSVVISNPDSADQLMISNDSDPYGGGNAISTNAGNIYASFAPGNRTLIGTYSSPALGDLEITLNEQVTSNIANALAQHIAFQNTTSSSSHAGTRNITITIRETDLSTGSGSMHLVVASDVLAGSADNPTYVENIGDPVSLFSAIVITANIGETITQFSLVINQYNSQDQLMLDGSSFTLGSTTSPVTTLNGLTISGSETSSNQWTLQVTVPHLSTTLTENILNDATYKPASPVINDLNPRSVILEGFIESDGNISHNTIESDITPLVNAPTFSTNALSPLYYDDNIPVRFFGNTNITLADNELITGAALLLTNVSSTDILNVYGIAIPMHNGAVDLGAGGTLTVSVVDGTATLTLTNATFAPANVSGFINEISFQSSVALTNPARTLTISRLTSSVNNGSTNSYDIFLSLSSSMNTAHRSNMIAGLADNAGVAIITPMRTAAPSSALIDIS